MIKEKFIDTDGLTNYENNEQIVVIFISRDYRYC